MSELNDPLARNQRSRRIGGRAAHHRAGGEHDGIEPLLHGLQGRNGIAEGNIDAPGLEDRHREGPAFELADLDLDPLRLEEALPVGNDGAQRLGERQQADPELCLRHRRGGERAEQERERAQGASNDTHEVFPFL